MTDKLQKQVDLLAKCLRMTIDAVESNSTDEQKVRLYQITRYYNRMMEDIECSDGSKTKT